MILKTWYSQQVKLGVLAYDHNQWLIVENLDVFASAFNSQYHLDASCSFYNSLRNKLLAYTRGLCAVVKGVFFRTHRQSGARGFYLCGRVGSGKTMLIDALYRSLTTSRKQRVHFQQFMQNIGQSLAQIASGASEEFANTNTTSKYSSNHISTQTYSAVAISHNTANPNTANPNTANPLNIVAKNLSSCYKIIFLDEMEVKDIASAMILYRLFLALINAGVYLIITSNAMPNELYLDGLLRERFMPAIDLIYEQLTILKLDAVRDYRQNNVSNNELFIFGNDKIANHKRLMEIFTQLKSDIGNHNTQRNRTSKTIKNTHIIVQGRPISCIAQSMPIIWFEFAVICGDLRSQDDYLALVKDFMWFIIEDIVLSPATDNNTLRRFILLIDILYDNSCKIVFSASQSLAAINAMYIANRHQWQHDFSRTISRLYEMQSHEYLQKMHYDKIADVTDT